MFLLKIFSIWQSFAKRPGRAGLAFATGQVLGNNHPKARPAVPAAGWPPFCYPSPSMRPDPLRIGSPFSPALRHAFADRMEPAIPSRAFVFRGAAIEVFLRDITFPRSSISCVNLSLPSPFSPSPLWLAACRTPRRAGLPALLSVPLPLMRWTKTWLQARRLAVSPVRQAATWWAAATDLTFAACGRLAVLHGPSGHPAPVAFSISASRPGRGARGERCSTRS